MRNILIVVVLITSVVYAGTSEIGTAIHITKGETKQLFDIPEMTKIPKSDNEKKVDWVLCNAVKPNPVNFEDGKQLTGYSWMKLGEDFTVERVIKVGLINAEMSMTEFDDYDDTGYRNDRYIPEHEGAIVGFHIRWNF